MNKAIASVESISDSFYKTLSSGQEQSHYILSLDACHSEDAITFDLLKQLAYSISRWILTQNSKNTIQIQTASENINFLTESQTSDINKIQNLLWKAKPFQGELNSGFFLEENIKNFRNNQNKHKFFIILTNKTLKFDEAQIETLLELAGILVIFYGEKSTPTDLYDWCDENYLFTSNAIKINDYPQLAAFCEYIVEEPKGEITFSFKFIGTTSVMLQFEPLEGKDQQYEVEWKPLNSTVDPLQTKTSWTNLLLPDLVPNTEYSVRCRIVSGKGRNSKWSKNSIITTLKVHELEKTLRDTETLLNKRKELFEQLKTSESQKLKELKIPGINIMVLGRRGIGKSNFITSLHYILNGAFDSFVAPYGNNFEGTTQTLQSVRVLDYLRLWDCIGFDSENVDLVDWLPGCLDGEIVEGTKLEDSNYKKQEPTAKSKIHGAVLLVDDLVLRDSLLLKKTLEVITILTKRFVPFSIVFAKADASIKSPLKEEDLVSHPEILTLIKNSAQALKYSYKESLIYPVINYQHKPEANFVQFDYLMLRMLRDLVTNATKSILSNKKIVEVITTSKEKVGNLSLDSLNVKLDQVREMIHKMADDQFMFTRQDNFKISKKEEATLTVDDILLQNGDVLFIKINTHVKLD